MRTIIAASVLLSALLAGCGGDDDADSAPSSPDDWLARAQEALDSAQGYRLAMTGHNFTIPQWGGNDGGELVIGKGGQSAFGTLVRTGDGEYEVVYTANQTYFKRTTCDHFARIPGGGPDVLRPFLLARTSALSDAEKAMTIAPRIFFPGETPPTVTIVARLPDVGLVQIVIDVSTSRPVRLYLADNGSGTTQEWEFTGWGQGPQIATPIEYSGDQGPGGNPC